MRICFSIRVIDANGNGIPDAEVVVHYPYGTDDACTDESGWVRFEKEHYFGDYVRATVYINGELKDELTWFEDGETISYTME